jgi:hypothetical protein
MPTSRPHTSLRKTDTGSHQNHLHSQRTEIVNLPLSQSTRSAKSPQRQTNPPSQRSNNRHPFFSWATARVRLSKRLVLLYGC